MRITGTLAAGLALAVTAVQAGLQEMAIPGNIKSGDSFTVHTHDATTRNGEYHVYWGYRPLQSGPGLESKTALGNLFHVTNYDNGINVDHSYNGTIKGLRLPEGLKKGPYVMVASVTGFMGAMKNPTLTTWYWEFNVAAATDPHETGTAKGLVWAAYADENSSRCYL